MKIAPKEHDYYTYILHCADSSYYVGITNNIKRRYYEHQNGNHPKSYTAKRLPVSLVHYEHFTYVWNAIAREKQLKRWIRNKKAAIVANNTEELRSLSKRQSKFTAVTKIRWNLRRKLLRRTSRILSE